MYAKGIAAHRALGMPVTPGDDRSDSHRDERTLTRVRLRDIAAARHGIPAPRELGASQAEARDLRGVRGWRFRGISTPHIPPVMRIGIRCVGGALDAGERTDVCRTLLNKLVSPLS